MWIKALLPDLHCWPRSIDEVTAGGNRCGPKACKGQDTAERKAKMAKEPEAETKIRKVKKMNRTNP